MKLCLPGSGMDMDTLIDPRFGRCHYFIVIDPETFNFEAEENPFQSAPGGAGIQAAQWMANRGVKTVLASRVGPNALKALEGAGIAVITGLKGKIREAVDNYRAGELMNPALLPDTVDHKACKCGTRPGLGPVGECVCAKCGATVAHRRGIPCREEVCPECGSRMRRR